MGYATRFPMRRASSILLSTLLVTALVACGGGEPLTAGKAQSAQSAKAATSAKAAETGTTIARVTASMDYDLRVHSRANCLSNNESVTRDANGELWDMYVYSYQTNNLGDTHIAECEGEVSICVASRPLGALTPGVWTVEGTHGISAGSSNERRAYLRDYCDFGYIESGIPQADLCRETRATNCNI